MRRFFLIQFFFAFSSLSPCSAQSPSAIDSITNYDQLLRFIRHLNPADTFFTPFSGDGTFNNPDTLPIHDGLIQKGWFKGDFDGNGYADIFIEGNSSKIIQSLKWGQDVRCIMSYGNNIYKTEIVRPAYDIFYYFPRADESSGQTKIAYYHPVNDKTGLMLYPVKLDSCLLVYKYNGFVEENKSPVTHHIEEIQFGSDEFDLTIQTDRTAVLNIISDNPYGVPKLAGKYQFVLDSSSYRQITGLLNYMNFTDLKSQYPAAGVDLPSAGLHIIYDGGQTKIIGDYGMAGTFGLFNFYRMMRELKEKQNWIFVKKKGDYSKPSIFNQP